MEVWLPALTAPPKGCGTLRFGLQAGICLRPSLPYTLQRPIPSGRGGVTPPSPHRLGTGWRRNLDRLPIGYPFRVHLRSRLTRRRRTSRRNPCPSGGRDSHPPYRYSCRHPHFRPLHRPSRGDFHADRNAPLPPYLHARRYDPRLRHPPSCPIIFGASALDR